MNKSYLYILLFLSIILIGIENVSAAACDGSLVSGCTVASNTVYTLPSGVVYRNSTGFSGIIVINGDNITINGNGTTIINDGSLGGVGIYAFNRNNVTIENLTIIGFGLVNSTALKNASMWANTSGICSVPTGWSFIRRLQVNDIEYAVAVNQLVNDTHPWYHNRTTRILYYKCYSDPSLINFTATAFNSDIEFYYMRNSSIKNNNFTGAYVQTMWILGGQDLTVKGNSILSSGSYGIKVEDYNGNISRVNITGNIVDSRYVTDITYDVDEPDPIVFLDGVSNSEISYNNVTNPRHTGIYINGALSGTIYGNSNNEVYRNNVSAPNTTYGRCFGLNGINSGTRLNIVHDNDCPIANGNAVEFQSNSSRFYNNHIGIVRDTSRGGNAVGIETQLYTAGAGQTLINIYNNTWDYIYGNCILLGANSTLINYTGNTWTYCEDGVYLSNAVGTSYVEVSALFKDNIFPSNMVWFSQNYKHYINWTNNTMSGHNISFSNSSSVILNYTGQFSGIMNDTANTINITSIPSLEIKKNSAFILADQTSYNAVLATNDLVEVLDGGCNKVPSANYTNSSNNVVINVCSGTYYVNESTTSGQATFYLSGSNQTLRCNNTIVIGNGSGYFVGYTGGIFKNNNQIIGCTVQNYYYGIYMLRQTKLNISQNTILDTYMEGMAFIRLSNSSITNNVVNHSYGSAGFSHCVYISQAGYDTYNNTVAYNNFTNCAGGGLSFNAISSTNASINYMDVHDNYIANNDVNIQDSGTRYSRFYNNILSNASTYLLRLMHDASTPLYSASFNEYYNNTFTRGSAIYHISIRDATKGNRIYNNTYTDNYAIINILPTNAVNYTDGYIEERNLNYLQFNYTSGSMASNALVTFNYNGIYKFNYNNTNVSLINQLSQYPYNDLLNISTNSILASNIDNYSLTLSSGQSISVGNYVNVVSCINSSINLTVNGSVTNLSCITNTGSIPIIISYVDWLNNYPSNNLVNVSNGYILYSNLSNANITILPNQSVVTSNNQVYVNFTLVSSGNLPNGRVEVIILGNNDVLFSNYSIQLQDSGYNLLQYFVTNQSAINYTFTGLTDTLYYVKVVEQDQNGNFNYLNSLAVMFSTHGTSGCNNTSHGIWLASIIFVIIGLIYLLMNMEWSVTSLVIMTVVISLIGYLVSLMSASC